MSVSGCCIVGKVGNRFWKGRRGYRIKKDISGSAVLTLIIWVEILHNESDRGYRCTTGKIDN